MLARRTLPALIAAATAAALAGCGLQQDIASEAPPSSAPTQAPVIQGALLDGAPFSWSSIQGHVAVLDFWASWCGPCRGEQPQINAIYRAFAARGVRFLGIDMRDPDADAARAYRSDFSVPYQSIIDSSEEISAEYDVIAPPTVVVLDQQGVIVDRFLGTVDAGSGTVSLSDELNDLLR